MAANHRKSKSLCVSALACFLYPHSAYADGIFSLGDRLELELNATVFEDMSLVLGSGGVDAGLIERASGQVFDEVTIPGEVTSINELICTNSLFGITCDTVSVPVVVAADIVEIVPTGKTAYIEVSVSEELAQAIDQVSDPELKALLASSASSTFAFLVAKESVNDSSCSEGGLPDKWPYDVAAVLKQLAVTMRHATVKYTPQSILVLDTGLFSRSMPADWQNGNNRSVALTPSLEKVAVGVEGVNLATYADSASPPTHYELGWHGMAVADVALGTRLAHDFRSITGALPTVQFASNLTVSEGETARIASTSLVNAYEYASTNNIPIINVSFLINERIPSLDTILAAKGKDVLLVVAAGNDGQSSDLVQSWPGFLGGDRSNGLGGAIITVGSHDVDGSILEFSRRDAHRVDILAPGCEIPTIVVKSGDTDEVQVSEASMSGTSFSAPLVSFTAAILSGFGLKPLDIKDRINISSSVRNELDGVTFSRGVLNIEDALAFTLVVYRSSSDGGIARHLAEPVVTAQNVKLCGKDFRLGKLAKVSRRVTSDGKSMLHIWERANFGAEPRQEMCETMVGDSFSIVLHDFETGDEIRVTIDDLVDLIMPSN